MLFAVLLATSVSLSSLVPLSGHPQTVRLERLRPFLVVNSVYLNGSGPYRFLLDTGAQSSAVSPAIAAKLGIRPDSRVRQVTSTGEVWVGAARVRTIALETETSQRIAVADLEVLIGGFDGVRQVDRLADGVLGHNFLLGRNYRLDFDAGRLTLDPTPEHLQGDQIPFRVLDGRITVEVDVAGKRQKLVLDSGAAALILFDQPFSAPSFSGALLTTNSGDLPVRVADQRVCIGRSMSKRLPAISVRRGGAAELVNGVLPASAFHSIYVDSARGYVIFNPILKP
jgi:predicted aspartyl protease